MFNCWHKLIYKQASHSAFTDLCEYRQQLYCCFRVAQDHISPDGNIVIIQLDWQGEPLRKTVVRLAGADLRDPKLSVDKDGKLILLAYGRHRDAEGTFLYSQPYVWFSNDAQSWSCAKPIGQKNWWLWRISWFNDKALGMAYNRRSQSLDLYLGNPLRTFERVVPEVLSLSKHGLGYPNESDICFDSTGTAYAIVRRDADNGSAQLGMAKPPYRQWHWQSLGFYLGGPTMLMLNDHQALVCGRIWQQQGPKTALITLDLQTLAFQLLSLLHSGGDCSYPGLVKKGNDIYISHYSSHIEGHSRIYLDKITLSLLVARCSLLVARCSLLVAQVFIFNPNSG